MNRTNTRFESQAFLQNDLHMFVNRFTEDFTVPFHQHDFIEFCYVAEGSGFHHIEQDTFPIHKGLLFVIPIGVSHVFRPVTPDRARKPPTVYNCLFDTDLAAQLSSLQEQPIQEHLSALGSSASSYYAVFDRDGSIENIMLQLHREMSAEQACTRTMLYALLNQLIVTVYRLKCGETKPPAWDSTDFQYVLHYLEQNFNQSVTLSVLSRMSGWSPRHLQRLFQTYTGQTFGSFLQQLRIRKSCEMLRSGSLKIGLIAELAGYRNIDSFNAAFKKSVGLTPTDYRKVSSAQPSRPTAAIKS